MLVLQRTRCSSMLLAMTMQMINQPEGVLGKGETNDSAAHSLQHAWNPHSRRSTAAAKATLEDLLIYVPPEEPKLQVCSTSFGPFCALADSAFAWWLAHLCWSFFVAVHSLPVWQDNRLMYEL